MIGLKPAEQLLQRLGITEPREIDIDAIAYDCHAVIRYEPLDGCEACILGRGEQAIILVNSQSRLERKRFSAGHELGHWHHHKGQSFVCRADDIGNQTRDQRDPERIADAYAADLLMPRYLFEPAAEASKAMTLEVVKKLAGEFKTSLTATSIRYVDLGPHPTMIVCHSQLKRRWFHSGPLLPADLYPLAELHHESAAFEILFGSQRTIAPKTISADKWFSRRGAIRYELVEHSMRTNENEVLTLLWIKDDSFLHS